MTQTEPKRQPVTQANFPLQFLSFFIKNSHYLRVDDIIWFATSNNPFFHEQALFRVTGSASKDSWLLELVEADYHANAPFVLPNSDEHLFIYRKSVDVQAGHDEGKQSEPARFSDITDGLEEWEIIQGMPVNLFEVGDVIPVEVNRGLTYFHQTVNHNPVNIFRGRYIVDEIEDDGGIRVEFVDDLCVSHGYRGFPVSDLARYDVWRKPESLVEI